MFHLDPRLWARGGQELEELLSLRDGNSDGVYSYSEKGKTSDDLFNHLDSFDGILGNGFNRRDLISFILRDGLSSLTRFYPYYRFHYDQGRQCLRVEAPTNQLLPLLSGDHSTKTPKIRSLLKKLRLRSKDLSQINARIFSANNIQTPATSIFVGAVHGAPAHERMVFKIVQALLSRHGPKKKFIIFNEGVGEPLVYSEKFARFQFKEIKRVLSDEEIIRSGRGIDSRSTMRLASLRKILESLPKNTLLKLSYENLGEMLGRHRKFRRALAGYSSMLALKALYGERLTILNPESTLPLTSQTIPTLYESRAPAINPIYSKHDKNLSQLSRHPCLVSRLFLHPKMIDIGERVKEDVDQRSLRWIVNLLSIARDPQLGPENGYSRTYLLFGGRGHMSYLSKHLKNQISTLFLGPRTQPEKILGRRGD